MRFISRQAGANESKNRTVKHATGKMEWDTRKFTREKCWKNYRLLQRKGK